MADPLAPVLAKAEEEIVELKEAIGVQGDAANARRRKIKEEFGDLLFVMANVARHLKVDPEAALREANAKFVRRFKSIERGCQGWAALRGRHARGNGSAVGRGEGGRAEGLREL